MCTLNYSQRVCMYRYIYMYMCTCSTVLMAELLGGAHLVLMGWLLGVAGLVVFELCVCPVL